MSSFHLINVWTDQEPGAGGFVPMMDSLLWQPDDFRAGHPAPALIYVHGWGGYPYDRRIVELGPKLADQGLVCLSLCLRRRGMEGQLNSMPDDDLRDIKLAVDFLHTQGCRKVFLLGQELGGYSAARYLSNHRDRRVAGLLWMNPVDEPSTWLRQSVGDDAYQSAMTDAGIAARQGAAMDVRIDLFPETGPTVTQQSLAFLSWWSPAPPMSLSRTLEDISAPLALIADNGHAVPEMLADYPQLASDGEPHAAREENVSANLVEDIVSWVAEQGARQLLPVTPETLHVDANARQFFGLLWPPAGTGEEKTALVIVHGLTSSPLSPLIQQIAPVIAASGIAVLAGEMHRSGWAGHESSVLDNDLEDIDRWVSALVERGYDKIVLAGASIGSISVGRYLSVRQHPNVVALAHLMPTAECPDWFRKAAGDGPYAEAVVCAQQAVADGQGEQVLVDVDIRQPPPSIYGSRFRWTQRAAAWLSWFGPEADSRNLVHIANAEVPLLLLSGTADSYNDPARFAELKAAATKAPSVDEIWYPDVDHGLAGVEHQVALDLVSWMQKAGAFTPAR